MGIASHILLVVVQGFRNLSNIGESISLLPRHVTAEQLGLDPVNGDQDTVAS